MLKRAMVVLVFVGGCSGGDPQGKTIGAQGGTVTSADGRLTLTIPEGALSADTRFTMTRVERANWAAEIAALEPLSEVYDVQPEGTQFAVPATLRWAFDEPGPVDGPSYSLLVGMSRAAGGAIEPHVSSTASQGAERSAETTITHLSQHWLGARYSLIPLGLLTVVPVGGTQLTGVPWVAASELRIDHIDTAAFLNTNCEFHIRLKSGPLEFDDLRGWMPYTHYEYPAAELSANCSNVETYFPPLIPTLKCVAAGPAAFGLVAGGEKADRSFEVKVECLDPVASGYAWAVDFTKISSVSAASVEKGVDGKYYATAATGVGSVTVLDPTGAPTRQLTFTDATSAVDLTDSYGRGDGSIVIAGTRRGGGGRPFVALIGADDMITWATSFGVGSQDRSSELAYLGAAEGYVVGFGNNFGNGKLQVARFDASGAVSSVLTIGADQEAKADTVSPRTGGGYFIAGIRYTGPAGQPPTGNDTVLVAMNTNDTIAWQKILSNGGRVFADKLLPLADGGVLAIGTVQDLNSTTSDGLLMRFASDGTLTWQKRYPTVVFRSAIETASGFRVAGESGTDMALFELGSDGTTTSARTYNDSGANEDEYSRGLGANAGGGVTLVGYRHAGPSWQVFDTAADGTVTGCGDGMIGASLSVAAFAGSTSLVDVAESALSVTVDSAPSTAAAPALSPVRADKTPANTCGP